VSQAIEYRDKPAADGPRYRAIGNSIPAPVVRWITDRIRAVESCATLHAGLNDRTARP
jgi:DNA (cytosine-5)-methyltransferase 1